MALGDRRRREREEESGRGSEEASAVPQFSPLDLIGIPPPGLRGRLQWLKSRLKKYSHRLLALGQRPGHADPAFKSTSRTQRPHGDALHLGSNSQVRIRKNPATPTTTTKVVSVRVPTSEVSCSTCIIKPDDTKSTPGGEGSSETKTYNRTER
jgi:hypothetical protein